MGETLTLEDAVIYDIIEEDTPFFAEVVDVSKRKLPFTDDQDNDIWKFNFKFILEDPDGENDNRPLWGETGVKFSIHPDCVLTNWAREILGMELDDPGFKLDTDMLTGNRVKIIVGVRTAKKADKDGEFRRSNFVKDVMRVKRTTVDNEPF